MRFGCRSSSHFCAEPRVKIDESSSITSQYLMTVCQCGSEAALKEEVEFAERPLTIIGAPPRPLDLRPSFMKPGFVTFKADRTYSFDDLKEVDLSFARVIALQIDKGKIDSKIELVRQIPEKARAALRPGDVIHVGHRDGKIETSLFAAYEVLSVKNELETRLMISPRELLRGARVFTGVQVSETEVWWGVHLHRQGSFYYPLGVYPHEVPEGVPSRAWLKIEEALEWQGVSLMSGDTAVEVGSSPGGATWALLKRGLNVVGIDPAEMDAHLLKQEEAKNFQHVRMPVAQVLREDLPDHVDWLLLDMNIAPQAALASVFRLGRRMRSTLKGVFFTMKLNEWRFGKELPQFREAIRQELGFRHVQTKQLSSNGQEVLLVALR